MLEQIITSQTRINLLLKFFLNPHTKSYLRQLASEFNESTNSIRVELNRLSKAQILSARFEGRNKIYQANRQHPLYDEIRSIVLKSTGIDRVFSNILRKVGTVHSAFIRGDYAKGKDSGLIDLVIVGNDLNHHEIERVRKKTEGLIDRKISLLLLNITEYKELKSAFQNEPIFLLLSRELDNGRTRRKV